MTTSALALQGAAVKAASRILGQASSDARGAVLRHVADRLEESLDELLEVNALEVEAYRESGPGRDRLRLTGERVGAMASALREIADRPDPLFETLDEDTRPNGLRVERLRVPLAGAGLGA